MDNNLKNQEVHKSGNFDEGLYCMMANDIRTLFSVNTSSNDNTN